MFDLCEVIYFMSKPFFHYCEEKRNFVSQFSLQNFRRLHLIEFFSYTTKFNCVACEFQYLEFPLHLSYKLFSKFR